MKRIKFLTLLLAFFFGFIAMPTKAATFDVNDEASLNAAITTAGSNGEADTIRFLNDIAVAGVLNFFAADGGNTLTIEGNGFTLSGSDAHMLFPTGSSTIINNLRLEGVINGVGGGIRNIGTLSINNSTIANNQATATNGGGGILNAGTLNISNSTISNNLSQLSGGGGIRNNGGTLNISNSTIANNQAGQSSGGGILNSTGTLNIDNSTISNNSVLTPGNAGGGISASGVVTISNSIVSGNTADVNSDCNIIGTFNANANNLFGSSGSNQGCTNGVNDIVPTVGIAAILSPLANNGGDTETMALVAGSPALDAADNANCPANDQRGEARGANAIGLVNNPEVGDCDIGAFELYTPIYGSTPVVGSSINLGATAITTEITSLLEIEELGGADLIVSLNSITGANAADFRVIGLPTTISDGNPPQDITIVCTPSVVAILSATVTFNTNDPAQATVSYDLTCEGLAATVITNTVTVTLPGGETVVVNAETEYILKTVDNPFATVGQTVIYTIRARNPKTIPLTQVNIYDVFDERLVDVQLLSTTHGVGVFNANTLTVSGFTLQPQEEAVIVVSARIGTLRAGETIPNAAILESPDASVHVSNLALVGDNPEGNSGGAAQVFLIPSQLPSTGESPLWRSVLLIALTSSIFAIAIYLYRKLRLTSQMDKKSL